MANGYAAWRENEVKRVGGKVQRDAESLLDQHAAQPIVTLNDDQAGRRTRIRRNIADTLVKRGQCSAIKIHSYPSQAYKAGWERVFGQ